MPQPTENPYAEIYNDRGGQMTFGFLGTGQAISPFGFISWGFLWQCNDIWTPGISLSTSWNSADTPLVTNWTGPIGTPWAEC